MRLKNLKVFVGIAFLIFVGSELAHIGWIMMSEKGKNIFDRIPYKVDFSNKEATSTGSGA